MKTKTTIDTRFFRAGVGTVLYNQNGEVAFFERAQNPVGVWQFQQGGIDLDEQPESTLWRELKEEVGIDKDDIAAVDEYPHWTVYQYAYTKEDSSTSRLGQAHRWYFLKLKSGVVIDLEKATEREASSVQWVSFPEAIKRTKEESKRRIYAKLMEYFSTTVFPTKET